MSVAAIVAILRGLWSARYFILAFAVAGAFFWWSAHERHAGEAKVKAQYEHATLVESARRTDEIEKAQAIAQAATNQLATLQSQNESLQNEIERVSHAHDADPCLDSGAVDRLRRVGRRSSAGN